MLETVLYSKCGVYCIVYKETIYGYDLNLLANIWLFRQKEFNLSKNT